MWCRNSVCVWGSRLWYVCWEKSTEGRSDSHGMFIEGNVGGAEGDGKHMLLGTCWGRQNVEGW